MKHSLCSFLPCAVLLAGACAGPGAAPASTLVFGFTHVEIPVTTEGLTLTVEVLNPEGSSLGTLSHNVASGLKLRAAAEGLGNQIRTRFGVAYQVSSTSGAEDAPVTLFLEGGYRFGTVTQRHNRGSSVYSRGSTLRIRRSGD